MSAPALALECTPASAPAAPIPCVVPHCKRTRTAFRPSAHAPPTEWICYPHWIPVRKNLKAAYTRRRKKTNAMSLRGLTRPPP